MPQVPYKGYPEGGPQHVPLRPDIPEAGLLAGARASEAFGRDLRGAGEEIFNTALRMKQLENETEANEADTKFTLEAGDLHAKYNALQGQDRVNEWPKYSSNLQEARARIRAGLSNDMARRMYDHQSLGTMHRSIFNGAAAAATAQKDYSIKTAGAQLELLRGEAGKDPLNNAAFSDLVQKTELQAKIVAREHGLGGASAEVIRKESVSKMWRSRIEAVYRVDHYRAEEMRDAAEKSGVLNDVDAKALFHEITNQAKAVESANIGGNNFDKNKDEPQAIGREATREEARKKRPNDPQFERQAVQDFNTRYRTYQYDLDQQRKETVNTIKDNIVRYNPRNLQELRAIGNVAEHIDSLPDHQQAWLPGYIARYHAAESAYDNDKRDSELRAMFRNQETRLQYQQLDISKEPLSKRQMDWHIANQGKMLKDKGADKYFNYAWGILKREFPTQLETLHVLNRSARYAKDYIAFQGTLNSALDAFRQREERLPNEKELKEIIGPALIRGQAVPRFGITTEGISLPGLPPVGGEAIFGYTGEPPIFKQKATREFRRYIDNEHKRQGKDPRTLTDDDYNMAYRQHLFNEAYTKQKSAQ